MNYECGIPQKVAANYFGQFVLLLAGHSYFGCGSKLEYRSRALKSRSKLRAAMGLRATLGNFLLHRNSSLFTVTFGDKVLTLAKSRSS